jgi:hypothetical protein
VAAAIIKGEERGDRKYTRRKLKTDSWTDVDWYVYCLIMLREENKTSWKGVFRGKMMTNPEMDSRLWQAIKRATKDRAPSVLKKAELRQKTKKVQLVPDIANLSNLFGEQRRVTGPAFSNAEDLSSSIKKRARKARQPIPDSFRSPKGKQPVRESQLPPSLIIKREKLLFDEDSFDEEQLYKPDTPPRPSKRGAPQAATSNTNVSPEEIGTSIETGVPEH